jgi:hypothetical protein
VKLASDAHDRKSTDFEVEIGGAVTAGGSQKIVNF